MQGNRTAAPATGTARPVLAAAGPAPYSKGSLLGRPCPHEHMQYISIRGARTHNLRNMDLDLPRDRLIVITGLSGSGKSSLAFDTIYAEGQRRYVESLSAYARQFLSMMDKPDVDHIEGLSPAISIEQKTASHNPRSTVGTVTEIYDYLRLLFARAGTPRCPNHGRDLLAQTVSQMVDQALALPEGTRLMLLAPVVQARKGEHMQLLAELRTQGYVRARIDGALCELDDPPKLDLRRKHTIEVVVDRFKVREDVKQRLAESFETALKLADGVVRVAPMDPDTRRRAGRDAVFRPLRLPGLQLQHCRTRATPVLVQQSGRGLRDLRRSGREAVLRSGARGALPGSEPRRRRDPRLGPAQCLVLLHAAEPGEALRIRHRAALQRTARNGSRRSCSTAAARKRSSSATSPAMASSIRRKHAFEGILPNLERRYRETDSGMVREELAKFLSSQPCPECAGHAPEYRGPPCVSSATSRSRQ